MAKQLHTIKDVKQLREVTRLLQVENDQLHKQLQKLSRKVDALSGQDARTLQLEIKRLKAALDGERNKHNAKKSERRRPHRRTTPKEPKTDDAQTGGARTTQEELLHVTKHCELTEAQRTCPNCDKLATVMQGAYESSEVIDVVERTFTVTEVRRHKAVHDTCTCAPCKIVTAPGPTKLVPKGRFTLNFGVQVAVAKYFDHIPLELQSTQMRRQGLIVQPNVLWSQLEHQAKRWAATYEGLRLLALESPCVNTDDTGWPMLELGRKTWQAFVLSTPDLTYIDIAPSKAHQRVVKLLTHPDNGPYTGTVMCDGASNFTKAQRVMGTFTIANDWSHARRKFVEAAPDYPVANEVLEIIARLYAVERDAMAIPNMTLHEARRKLRRERSKPALNEIKQWAKGAATSWNGSDLNRAIRYMDRRWKALEHFVEHPEVPLHNNPAEFALRKPVRGRKNFHGTKSRDGARVAAMAYTLCETARKHGLAPELYLRAVFLNDLEEPGTVTLPSDVLATL